MVYAYSDEVRIDIDQNELNRLKEHNELVFEIPNSQQNLRLVYHDKDLSEKEDTDRTGRTFG